MFYLLDIVLHDERRVRLLKIEVLFSNCTQNCQLRFERFQTLHLVQPLREAQGGVRKPEHSRGGLSQTNHPANAQYQRTLLLPTHKTLHHKEGTFSDLIPSI